MEQATVNLFAEMGVQPGSLIAGLVAGAEVHRHHPADARRSPPDRRRKRPRRTAAQVTVTGTATDAGGGVVAGVEVSTDGGSTWHPATLTTPAEPSVNWSYTWIAHGNPTTTIRSRAVDDSGQPRAARAGRQGERLLPVLDLGHQRDARRLPTRATPSSVEVGVKFTSETFGTVERHPLLQVGGQHRHARRQPVDRKRPTAGLRDLHGRNGIRLAAGELLQARARSPRTPPTSRLLRPQRATTPRTPTTSTRRPRPAAEHAQQPAAARGSGERHRSATASTVYTSTQRLPHQQLPGSQLLGRPDLHALLPPGRSPNVQASAGSGSAI